ncbi:hypothetical protein V8F06_008391 [Rhypophila decipiens]
MDPASIVGLVASCTSLVAAVGKSSVAIHSCVRSCRDARKELAETARQLVELKMVVNFIKDDFEPFTHVSCQRPQMPDSLATEIPSIVANCSMVLTEFDTIVAKSIAKAIYSDTQKLVEENAAIKDNVELLPGIKDQLDELRDQLENLPAQLMGRGVVHQPPGFALQRWLDTATSYYEHSVADSASIYGERPTAASDSGDESYEEELLAPHEDTRAPVRNQAQDELRDPNSLDAQIRTHLTEGLEVVPQIPPESSSSFFRRKYHFESSDSDAQSQATTVPEIMTPTWPLQNDPEPVQAHLDPDILDDLEAQLHDGTALREIWALSQSCDLCCSFSLSGLSLGGQFLAFQSQENSITVIETSTDQQFGCITLPDIPLQAIWSARSGSTCMIMPTPNGRALLSHCGNLVPRLYCVSTNAEFRWDSSPGHNKERRVHGGQVGVSPDGQFLVVYFRHWSKFVLKQLGEGYSDPRLSVWAIEYDRLAMRLIMDHKLKKHLPDCNVCAVTSVGITPDSQKVVLTLDIGSSYGISSATRALIQPTILPEWSPRALDIPYHEARFVTFSKDLSPRFEEEQSQTLFQNPLPEDLFYSFGSGPDIHCFDIYGEEVELGRLKWIAKAEYGAVSPGTDDELWIVWVSSCGSFVATVRADNNVKLRTKLLFSIWHIGSKRLVFGPHNIGRGGWNREVFDVQVKAGVVAVQWEEKLWYWKLDRIVE